eukprot:scaffold1737_cov60-Phaeocystis_antarctica.AAC.1
MEARRHGARLAPPEGEPREPARLQLRQRGWAAPFEPHLSRGSGETARQLRRHLLITRPQRVGWGGTPAAKAECCLHPMSDGVG